MPFPSLGCQTCRSRHIKCDEGRPTCGQCKKSGRQCAGFDAEPGGMIFCDENVFASNRSFKRPRGGVRRSPPKQHTQKTPPKGLTRPSLVEQSGQSQTRELNSVPAELSMSVEEASFHAFYRDFIDGAVKYKHDIWCMLGQEGFEWGPQQMDSAFNLAASAVSMAVFARKYNAPQALSGSRSSYSKALVKTQQAITEQSVAPTDQLLITVMLLSAYEDRVCNFNRTTLFAEGFRHQDGALALLKMRQGENGRTRTGLQLDKLIRRQLLRMNYLRATVIPSWLRDGEYFGEEGCDLELDRCLVKTVGLRHRIVKVSEGMSGLQYARTGQRCKELQNIIRECLELENRLSAWPLTLPTEYHYEVVNGDTVADAENSLFYSGTTHWYQGIRYSTAWNRYRVTRLACNGMISHAIRGLSSWSEPLEDHMNAVLEEAISTVRRLVDEMCASVPFFFGVISPQAYAAAPKAVISDASCSAVYQLVWPLTVCAASTWVPEHQRQWVRRQLYLVSQATGSGVVEALSQVDLQEGHRRLAQLSINSGKDL